MSDQKLREWAGDPLSQFFANAQYNERVTSLNMPGIYDLLQRVDAVFLRVAEITEKESTDWLLPPRFMMTRAHAAWRGAVRMAMAGEVVEAYPLVRAVIEHSWYALHIAKDPAPPARAEIWLRRHDDDASTRRCREEFKIGNVRATHETLDGEKAAIVHTLYERTIDFGGHPNQHGILSALKSVDTADGRTYDVAYLSNDDLLIASALKTAIEAFVGALQIFSLIFPERFRIMGLGDDIAKLVGRLNSVFKPVDAH